MVRLDDRGLGGQTEDDAVQLRDASSSIPSRRRSAREVRDALFVAHIEQEEEEAA